MDIAEIRQQYPQYSDLSDQQVARGFHNKFYSDIPFDDFAKKIGVKYGADEKIAEIPGRVAAPEKGIDSPIPGAGTAEAALAMGSGIVGNIAGKVGAFAKGLFRPETYTAKGAPGQFEKDASSISRALTYQPRTQQGQETLDTVTGAIDSSKLAGLPPTAAVSLANMAPQRLNAARGALPAVAGRESAAVTGGGAANVPLSSLRAERAAQLPVPMDLTKGMLSRDFDQQRFERETAKSAVGAPIRERMADLNQKLMQNMEAFGEQTGADASGPRATGEIVNKALAGKAAKAKGEINAAYEKARAAGETQAPVDITPLRQYVESHQPEAINAPIISSVDSKLKAIAKGNTTSVNDLEEMRKMVNALSGKDATNAHFGKELKGVIDQIGEGAGGEAYQYARSLRREYAKEFENVGVIDKLMSSKPGTTDRRVAFEDVFDHSVLKGSLDDVRAVRRTLQTAGPEGMQAWRELQGQTIKHLQDQMTKNIATDQRGNRVVSAAQLNRVVTELDKDGKLDLIFGKKGAGQIRDVRDVAIDVNTFPLGSVNTSNTGSVVMEALATAAVGRLPTAFGKAIAGVKQYRENAATKRKVIEALNPSGMVSLKDLATKSQNRNALREQP